MSTAFSQASGVISVSHNFTYGLTQGLKVQEKFIALLTDERCVQPLKRDWNIDVTVRGVEFDISSPIGMVHGEFVTSMDKMYPCKAVIFHDLDSAGEKRDLYAVRLTNEPGHWIESDGSIMARAIGDLFPAPHVMVELLKKVLAHKLAADDERVERLFVQDLAV